VSRLATSSDSDLPARAAPGAGVAGAAGAGAEAAGAEGVAAELSSLDPINSSVRALGRAISSVAHSGVVVCVHGNDNGTCQRGKASDRTGKTSKLSMAADQTRCRVAAEARRNAHAAANAVSSTIVPLSNMSATIGNTTVRDPENAAVMALFLSCVLGG